MTKYRNLDRGDVFPASWTDAIQEFIGTIAANVRLTVLNATTVRAVAGTGRDQAALGIDGLWRERTTNQDVAVTGAAGTYDVFAVTSANQFVTTPDPDTDTSDYNWYVQVLLQGTTPSGNTPAGRAIAAYRKIGEVDWSGTAIDGLVMTSGHEDATLGIKPTARHATQTPLRVRGIASQSAALIAAGSSAAAADRMTLTAAGQLTLPVQGAGGGLLLGGDVKLYRSAADVLATDDALTVVGGTQPGSVAGSGASAVDALSVPGVKGGNTTGTTGQTAGNGSGLSLSSGAGGDAPGGSTNGNGGMIWLAPGAAGAGAGTAGKTGALVLANTASRLRFFANSDAASVTQRTGWGASLAGNFAGATSRKSLTVGFTLNELRDALATVIDELRQYGLLGT